MKKNHTTGEIFSAGLADDLGDLQGLILSGYNHLDHVAYWFLHFSRPTLSRAWLAALLPHVTTGDWRQPDGRVGKPETTLNLAFTPHGLAALSFPSASLQSFPEEFLTGMSAPERSRRLGDTGASAPACWEIGTPEREAVAPIDVLVILQAPTPERLRELEDIWQVHHGHHEVSAHAPVQIGALLSTEREHFGFADGISQPEISGSPGRSQSPTDTVAAGEFVLGYLNAYTMLPPTPTVPALADPRHGLPPVRHRQAEGTRDFGRNGTYLVFRKLAQDVAAFRRYVHAHEPPEARGLLAAKMVGRWPSGAPLVWAPTADDLAFSHAPQNNTFSYHLDDPDGLRCPIGAHIRRAHPRDGLERDATQSLLTTSRHRIIRRGIPYGPPLPEGVFEDDGQERGLFFVCLNADIKRQFEFIQQTWMNDPKFAGLSHDRDPLVGDNLDPTAPDALPRHLTIQASPFRKRYTNLPRFVRVRGGGYFFMPSMAALRFLAGSQTVSEGKEANG
jgi:Dyp-type peroxidase family